MATLKNPFTEHGKWYKANFHTHSTTSDGRKPPREVAALYRKNGYHVLALTDHDRTNDISGMSRKNFLVINGMEYAPPLPGRKGEPHHLVAVNVPRGFAFKRAIATNANACIRTVKRAGGETILAHPYWCRHRYDQFSYLKGLVAMEVFNSTCDGIGRANSETDWSHLLDAGRIIPAVAADDTHSWPGEAFRGWVWLKMRSLSAANVLRALRTGCFFSSTGPLIKDLRIKDDKIILQCSPVETVYFILHDPFGGAVFKAGKGKSIRSLTIPLPSYWNVFRAVVVDRAGRRSWSNPVVIGAEHRAALKRRLRETMRASRASAYDLAAKAGRRQWHPLNLARYTNRPLIGDDAWFGGGIQMNQLPPGLHRIHGVPFRIPAAGRIRDANAVIFLRSSRLRKSGGRPLPPSVRVPVGRKCTAVYFLHAAGYATVHAKVAEYLFVFDDGKTVKKDIISYGIVSGAPGEIRKMKEESSVQDWWPSYSPFDSEHARNVVIADPAKSLDYRYLYTFEWINPRPGWVLTEIRLRANAASSAIPAVLAITVQDLPVR